MRRIIALVAAGLFALAGQGCAAGSSVDYGYGQFAGYYYSQCNCADDAHGGADRHGGSH